MAKETERAFDIFSYATCRNFDDFKTHFEKKQNVSYVVQNVNEISEFITLFGKEGKTVLIDEFNPSLFECRFIFNEIENKSLIAGANLIKLGIEGGKIQIPKNPNFPVLGELPYLNLNFKIWNVPFNDYAIEIF